MVIVHSRSYLGWKPLEAKIQPLIHDNHPVLSIYIGYGTFGSGGYSCNCGSVIIALKFCHLTARRTFNYLIGTW